MLLSKCAICSSTKFRFMKEQEVKSTIKTPLNKIPLLGDLLF